MFTIINIITLALSVMTPNTVPPLAITGADNKGWVKINNEGELTGSDTCMSMNGHVTLYKDTYRVDRIYYTPLNDGTVCDLGAKKAIGSVASKDITYTVERLSSSKKGHVPVRISSESQSWTFEGRSSIAGTVK